jgi:hypothetical protein
LNRTFLSQLLRAGIDAVFLDPLDASTMATARAALALLAADPYGLDLISAYRSGQINECRREKRS